MVREDITKCLSFGQCPKGGGEVQPESESFEVVFLSPILTNFWTSKATFGQCPKEIRFFMSCLRWVLAESPNRPDRQQAEATRQKEEQAKKINENHAREIKEELARTLNEEQAKKMKENQVRKTKEDIKRKRQAYLARSGLYWTAEKYMHYMKEKKNITIWY